jgi:mRNA interferase MazF
MNRHLGTVIVMPLTSGSRLTRFRSTSIFRGVGGLLLGDQIRSVAKSRLIKRVGRIDDDSLLRALAVLREMFEE